MTPGPDDAVPRQDGRARRDTAAGQDLLIPAAPEAVARSRIRFLTAEPVAPGSVRGTILASWRRSKALNVATDRVEQPTAPEVDTDSPLQRSADPVLRSLRDQLDGQPMSIVLTDPSGAVLTRTAGDGDLGRYLDRVMLSPGYNYAEQFVGTNGIGTALEVGGPAHVFGHEHYAENLEVLACAAVPVRHPITGRAVGAIDLTCWAKDAGPLLLTLAKTTAEQIRQALLADQGTLHTELLSEYLRTCRRMPGIVVAVSGDVVMLNDAARTALDPLDQNALVARAGEAITCSRRTSVLADLPSGAVARMYSRPVRPDNPRGGVVVHVRLLDTPGGQPVGWEAAPRVPLPGLIGSSPTWLRVCDEVERAYRAGEWLAVAGEPGVGKLALLQAVQRRYHPGSGLTVLDAADAADAWSGSLRRALRERGGAVVLRHLDALGDARLREVAAALKDAHGARKDPPWVAATIGAEPSTDAVVDVLRHFPGTVQVPPLRLHMDDLAQLVPWLLDRLGGGERLVCSSEAMKVLQRGSWPGNTGQLRAALQDVVRHRRAGMVQVDDLPPAVRAVSRRRLSQLESLERDAVVQSLVDAHGDKAKAASALGISRATIYRKIHEYGIVAPSA